MRPRALWRVSVTVHTEAAEEAVVEFLLTELGQVASAYTDLEASTTTVSVYLKAKPDWSVSTRTRINKSLAQLGRLNGYKIPPARLGKVPAANWAEAWKKHFKPLEIGKKLLLVPSWSRKRPRRGQAVVVLDPGMSFGTGQHPTTHFCLASLARTRNETKSQSFLDVGTGSGILAIAAAKLGYRPIHGLDLDPEAISIARANARSNGVLKSIRLECCNLGSLKKSSSGQFSMICANLLADVLLMEASRLIGLVQTGGFLVLAGILKREFGQIRQVYEQGGMRFVRSQGKGEWRSGVFFKKL